MTMIIIEEEIEYTETTILELFDSTKITLFIMLAYSPMLRGWFLNYVTNAYLPQALQTSRKKATCSN